MPLIKWTDEIGVGVAELDRQHQELVDVFNGFHDRLAHHVMNMDMQYKPFFMARGLK